MITAKLDVTKIDKTKLFRGEKGVYLDIILIETPNSQYDQDYMVCQAVSKEERAAGVKGAILGNAKIFEKRTGTKPKPAARPASAPKPEAPEDDVPF